MIPLLARLRCALRGRHNPLRQPVGGFRCVDCGEAGRDLGQMGYPDVAYVRPERRVFDRRGRVMARSA